MCNLTKKQRTVSIPLPFFKECEKVFNEYKDVCQDLEISSAAELVRVLARLGKPRFLEIVERVRTSGKAKKEEQQPRLPK